MLTDSRNDSLVRTGAAFVGQTGWKVFMKSSFMVMRESLLVAGTMYIGLGLN